MDDSVELARNLGIRTVTLPIGGIMKTYDARAGGRVSRAAADVTEENIQSRIRGNLLMALSNKFGSLLLTTGNKSEMAVGYCTLYGDMNGGLAVIADLPKMMVYRVARWRNRAQAGHSGGDFDQGAVGRAAAGQTDQDSLPPYELLDQILELHVEQCRSAEGDHRAGIRRGDGAAGAAAGADGRIQTQAGGAGAESDLARLRHGVAHADCSPGINQQPEVRSQNR